MSLLLAGKLPARIITVLQDFLPAELDTLDTDIADGLTTPDIPAASYYEWDAEFHPELPSCAVRVVSSTPIDIKPDTFGQRSDALHRFDILFTARRENANNAGTDSPVGLQALLIRYITGAVRVLCVMKEGLQTTADPTRFCTIVTWAGPAVYGPDDEQEDGAIVRTATLPIDVRMIEAR